MTIFYIITIGLAGIWLAGYSLKSNRFGGLGTPRKQFTHLPVALTVAAVLLAGCAGSPTPATNPAAQAPTTVAAEISSAATAPATAAAQATDVTPATGPTQATGASPSAGSKTYTLVQGKNQAQYSVREQLARLSFPTDAVGKTQQVSGSIIINPDGSIDQNNSKIVVDLTTLQTDSGMRDNYVRRNILHTDQYPQAVFVPTQVTGLPNPLPTSGPVSFQLTGNLTIQDVTKPVTWDVTGAVQGDQATGTATTTFTFEDFKLTQPQVPVVLSVVDQIHLQLDLTLQGSGS
jgi:polyisoprenoid-binding protein YceI